MNIVWKREALSWRTCGLSRDCTKRMLANGVTEWDDLQTGIALCVLISLVSD